MQGEAASSVKSCAASSVNPGESPSTLLAASIRPVCVSCELTQPVGSQLSLTLTVPAAAESARELPPAATEKILSSAVTLSPLVDRRNSVVLPARVETTVLLKK